MRKLSLLLGLVVVVAFFGCGEKRSNVLAPNSSTTNVMQVGDPTADDVRWVWIDETHVMKITKTSRWDVKLQRVVIGDIRVIYICDYPLGFIGPLPQGHCLEDGTHCS